MRPSNGTSNGADGSTIMLLAISIDESYIDGVQNVFFVFAIVAVPFTIIVTGSSLPSVIPPEQGCPCGCRPRWIAIRKEGIAGVVTAGAVFILVVCERSGRAQIVQNIVQQAFNW